MTEFFRVLSFPPRLSRDFVVRIIFLLDTNLISNKISVEFSTKEDEFGQ